MIQPDRRSLLKFGAMGLAGLSAPALANQVPGFTHGVASGEPGPSRVLLWTRFVAAGGESKLGWELAETEDFTAVIASGDAVASPARDWCAKAWAEGLRPGKWYYYRFVSPSGERSPVGRTRTLPQGRTARFRLAVFSCSNLGFGWFNAYAHAAEANDFDLAVHLGDYFYEYPRGEYPSAKQTLAGRVMPLAEAVTLAGYRERLSAYRADPDLQRLHQLLPMIAMRDDHEFANDAWSGGAENHQPAEGEWGLRKAAADQAWREWMPVSDDDFAAYEIGQLATLFRLETRASARSRQLDLVGAFEAGLPDKTDAAIAAFRDGAWRDPQRTLLGTAQEAWLGARLKQSVRQGKKWQVLAQQVIMGSLTLPAAVIEGMSAAAPTWLKNRLNAAVRGGENGVPYSMDMWDGYPAARERLLRSALDADANLLVLAGDSHNAWAFDLALGKDRAGAELAGHSVTSPGAENSLPWHRPADFAAMVQQRNPALKWCDTSQRGYLALELTPSAATGEWRFLASVRQRGTALAGTKRMSVLAGQRRFNGG